MNAVGDWILIEPITRNEAANENVKERIMGFELLLKDEGAPDEGYIRYIGPEVKDYEYKLGDRVIFDEPRPDGFRLNNIGFIAVKNNQIKGIINESKTPSL